MVVIDSNIGEFGIYPKVYLGDYTIVLRDLMKNADNIFPSTSVRVDRGVCYISIGVGYLEDGKNYLVTVHNPEDNDVVWKGKAICLGDINDINNFQPFDKSVEGIIRV